MSLDKLVEAAREARDRAYCPYSKYSVGAALLTEDGQIISGCNVENASYGGTICAERTAVVSAVARGHQRFKAIAVATRDGGSPCGICRQFLREFGLDLEVHLVDEQGRVRSLRLDELLPDSFGPDSLED